MYKWGVNKLRRSRYTASGRRECISDIIYDFKPQLVQYSTIAFICLDICATRQKHVQFDLTRTMLPIAGLVPVHDREWFSVEMASCTARSARVCDMSVLN